MSYSSESNMTSRLGSQYLESSRIPLEYAYSSFRRHQKEQMRELSNISDQLGFLSDGCAPGSEVDQASEDSMDFMRQDLVAMQQVLKKLRTLELQACDEDKKFLHMSQARISATMGAPTRSEIYDSFADKEWLIGQDVKETSKGKGCETGQLLQTAV